jgi:hypothetical protein
MHRDGPLEPFTGNDDSRAGTATVKYKAIKNVTQLIRSAVKMRVKCGVEILYRRFVRIATRRRHRSLGAGYLSTVAATACEIARRGACQQMREPDVLRIGGLLSAKCMQILGIIRSALAALPGTF